MNPLSKALDVIVLVLTFPLIPVGKTMVTALMILYVGVLLWLLVKITGRLRRKILDPLLLKSNLDASAQHAIAMLIRYLVVGIGALIILNTAGIETTALTVVAGAVGLGLSLGLQSLAKNFIGGLMIIMERSVRIGDRVEIAGTTGYVKNIALRATTLKTDDNLDVVIPNAEFMTQRIVNWTNETSKVRMSIPVTVSSENDTDVVKSTLLEIADQNEMILKDPKPEVWLEALSEKSMSFVLRVSTYEAKDFSSRVKSQINFAIRESFAQKGLRF